MTKNNRFSPVSEKGHFDGLVDEGEYLRQSLLYKQILPRPVHRSFSEGGTPSRLKTSVPSVISVANKQLVKIRVNSCLINDLRSTKDYVRNYKQNMQNKANFRKSQMNVNAFITMNYEQSTMNYEIKNKPNSKPIQSQFKPNTKPIQSQYKPNSNPIPKAKICCCV